ncbi:hypothetical protein [Candidatus Chlorohelix allophototropha]
MIGFFDGGANLYPDSLAFIDGDKQYTFRQIQTWERFWSGRERNI